MLAPILILAYKRQDKLINLIESLLQNQLAKFSTLYIYSDGPSKGDEAAVKLVRSYINEISGFKNIKIFFSETNTYQSISTIINIFLEFNKKLIILEDDNIVSPHFLDFMNSALNKYEMTPNVSSICGHSHNLEIPEYYQYDTYYCRRFSGYGLGLWSDRGTSIFNKVDVNKLIHSLQIPTIWGEFEYAGFDLISMISNEKIGQNFGDVRASINSIFMDKWQICPTKSLVKNNGLDGSGAHCGVNINDYLINGSYTTEFKVLKFSNGPDAGVLNAHAQRWRKNGEEVSRQLKNLLQSLKK